MAPTESQLHPDDTINIAALEVRLAGIAPGSARGRLTQGQKLTRGDWVDGELDQGATTVYPFGRAIDSLVRSNVAAEAELKVEVLRAECQGSDTTGSCAKQDPVTSFNLSSVYVKTQGGAYLQPVDIPPEDRLPVPEGRALIYYGETESATARFIFSVPKA